MKRLVPASVALLSAASTAAMAQDGGSSRFSAEFEIEIANDYTFDSDDPAAELNDTYVTIGAGLSFALAESTSINAGLVFEPILDPADDRFFEDHGLYVEELFLSHDFGGAEVVLGKFNPAFGAAWDLAPGIYGADFAEDYQITEKIGVGINIPITAHGGEHTLSFAMFNADRSLLSNSLGRERGQTNLAAGGVSNTRSPESYSVTLSGNFGATGYNFGVQHQEGGQGDVADQTGVVLGLTHSFETGSVPWEVLAEIAWFDKFDGTRNSARYYTLGASVPVGRVTLSGTYSVRDIDTAPTDRLATVAAEMDLAEGLSGALAYRWGREGGVDSNTIGTLLVYEF